MTLICLVRHGESAWNRERRIQGHRDPRLSPLGRRQAEAVADHLAGTGWDAVYSSDLARAVQTAAAIGCRLGLPALPEPGLRERGQGALEGLTAEQAQRAHPDFDAPDVGREPAAAFERRCVMAVARLAARHPARRVVVVTHGGVVRRLGLRFPLGPGTGGASPPDNGSVSILDTDGTAGYWLGYGDTAHLAAAGVHMRHVHPVLTALLDAG